MPTGRRLVYLAAASLIVLVLSLVGLYRIITNGSVLPAGISKKPGVMYFEGEKNALVNQPIVLKVMIDSSNQNVNAAGFYLKFDPGKVAVTDLSTLSSFCQFYPEKKYDNRGGVVSLACGAPHPGYKGKSELLTLTLMPLTIGTTTLRVTSDSKLLLSDGKGTNILDEYPSWEVQVSAGL